MTGRERGFTLLEVLVALAVAAVALSAAVSVVGLYVSNSARIQERIYAHWAASTVLVNGQLLEPWPDTEVSEGAVSFGGRNWFWRKSVAETSYDGVRRIEVQVFPDEDDDEPVTRLTGYAAEHSPW
jgi:general secretion pathway protein I